MASAAIIEVSEIVAEHHRRCAQAARERLGNAVRPLYALNKQRRPYSVATAILIEVDGVRCLATAAHALQTPNLLVAGADALTPLRRDWWGSAGKGSGTDNVDIAVRVLSEEEQRPMEGLPFIGRSEQMVFTSAELRYHIVVGYRASQNKAPVSMATRLQRTRWSFTSHSAPLPAKHDADMYDDRNFAVDYGEKGRRENAELVSTTPPIGVSGGAIFDLGSTNDYEQLCSPEPHPARLAGILIACPRNCGVLIGTNMETLRDVARKAIADAAGRSGQ